MHMLNPSRVLQCAMVLLFPGALSAASFGLNPVADAFVTPGPANDLGTNNYGGAGALSVAGTGTAKGQFQSVLQFDLSAAKSSFDTSLGAGQWNIQSITLRLTSTSPLNAIFNTSAAGQFGILWMQNDSWLEGTGNPGSPGTTGITYNTLQSSFTSPGDLNIGTFTYNGATSGNSTYTLTLASQLSNEVLNGSILSLRMQAADSSVSYLFDSRDFINASLRPLLTVNVTPVPEPSVWALLVLGFFTAYVFWPGRLAYRQGLVYRPAKVRRPLNKD